MNLKSLNDKYLMEKTDGIVREEREVLTKALYHFKEIERRRLYSEFGYKSLYDMLIKRYNYSEDQAYRRISAMRLLSELPEIEERINQGDLNLTHLGLAQNLFRQEKKIHQVEISKSDKLQVLEAFSKKTTREAEKIAFSYSSKPEELKADRVQAVSESKIELRFLASQETQKKIEVLKGLLAHQNPQVTLGELFEKLCDLGLTEWNPQKPAAPRKRRVKIAWAKAPEAQSKDGGSNSIRTGSGNSMQVSKESESDSSRLERGNPAQISKDDKSDLDRSGKEQQKAHSKKSNLKLDLLRKNQRVQMSSKDNRSKSARLRKNEAISAQVRRMIFQKAQNQCENCGSRFALEVDHVQPKAWGGPSEPENLRLLCRSCNQRAAIRNLGVQKMNTYLNS